MSDSIIGRLWGNYRVAEKLGQGGTGAVYKMEHIRLASMKAIKVINPFSRALAMPGKWVETRLRFQQEALTASALGGDRIVRVDDVGEWPDGIEYIVMEFIDGKNLFDDLFERKTIPTDIVIEMLYRLADTLAVVHSKGIVHRDIKPHNILLPRGAYRPVICDFGFASVALASQEIKRIITPTRVLSGTPGYASPEQVACYPTDGRSDIYSLAVIGYQALTGDLPHAPIYTYTAEAAAEFFMRPVPTIASKRPSGLPPVSRLVEHVINRALAMDVSRRYATAVEFRDALGDCLREIDSERADKQAFSRMSVVAVGVPLPARRTPEGEIDRMIERLRATAGVAPKVADVTAPPEEEQSDSVSFEEAVTPTIKEIEAIGKIIRRRFGIRTADARDGTLTHNQATALDFLRELRLAYTEGGADGWFTAKVYFRTMCDVLTDLSIEEIAFFRELMLAVRRDRGALHDWLAAHWE